MRILRFQSDGRRFVGVPRANAIGDETDAGTVPTHAAVLVSHDSSPLAADLPAYGLGHTFSAGRVRVSDTVLPVERLLAPVVPTDILCIGLNYRDHLLESRGNFGDLPDHPMLFIKASNTLNDPDSPIRLPTNSGQIDFEAELAVVIGRAAKDVREADALDYVFGYTAGNDVTARDWQRDKKLGGGQFARGKSFDGFCPLGPALVTADEVPDPQALSVRCTLNGETMQNGNTSRMIFPVRQIVASLSRTMTLRPGAVILTGTPAGVGMARTPPRWLTAGDEIAVDVETIGRLTNRVV